MVEGGLKGQGKMAISANALGLYFKIVLSTVCATQTEK